MRNRFALIVAFASISVTAIGYMQAHKATELKLRGEQDRIDAVQALLDSTNYGYAIVDEKGTVLEWNPALERLSQWTVSEVKGQGLLSIMPDGVAEQHADAFAAAMSDKVEHPEVQIVRCHFQPRDPNAAPIPVQITVRTVRTRDGRMFAIAHVDEEEQITEKPAL